MAERIISADSHMLVKDDRVLANLASKYHEAFLEAQAGQAPMLADPDLDPEGAERAAGVKLAAAGRAGEWDGNERLKDMDVDGIEAEVIYSDTAAGSRFYSL